MSLHVETLGSGPDLVLLHGWGMNAAVWEEVAGALARGFRVHLVDLPGHGASPLEGPFELEAVTGALLAALPERAAWVGWSLGAMLALAAAARAPERVDQLVLVAANPRFVADGEWPGMPAGVLAEFAEALARDEAATLGRFLALVARGSADRGVLRRLRALRGPVEPAALAGGLRILAEADLRPLLPALRQPLLLIRGGGDALVPGEAAPAAAALAPEAKVTGWPDTGHAPFLARPQAFVEALEGFLQ